MLEFAPVLTKALDEWDASETDESGLNLLNAFIGFLVLPAVALIPAMHKLRAATGKVLVKLPDGEESMLPIGAGGPATIGLGAPIRSVTSHPDGSDKVQAEACLFQEAEKLHKLGRPRKGTQYILSFGVAAANPATEKLMRDMHPTSRGPLVFAEARAQKRLSALKRRLLISRAHHNVRTAQTGLSDGRTINLRDARTRLVVVNTP
jgi:hypothetical protein